MLCTFPLRITKKFSRRALFLNLATVKITNAVKKIVCICYAVREELKYEQEKSHSHHPNGSLGIIKRFCCRDFVKQQ
jgi:hypothetical protein